MAMTVQTMCRGRTRSPNIDPATSRINAGWSAEMVVRRVGQRRVLHRQVEGGDVGGEEDGALPPVPEAGAREAATGGVEHHGEDDRGDRQAVEREGQAVIGDPAITTFLMLQI